MEPGQNAAQKDLSNSALQPEESIFNELVDTAPFQKSLKTARIWLYVIAGFQLLLAVINYFSLKNEDPDAALAAASIYCIIAAVFYLLALLSRRKPATSFLLALIFYIAMSIGNAFLEPESLTRGLLLRILVIAALAKGWTNAREVEKRRIPLG